jgi:muramoyltetrapeptide carboxypeptidase LdcA involved in peptidoglycan recycling
VVGLPFGHAASNLAFPIGARVEVDTGRGAVIWST